VAELESEESDPPAGEREAPEAAWARRWGKIAPKLAHVDLRPYVFISRDRRATLGSAHLTDQVEALIEKLSGSALHAAAIDMDTLAGLSAVDAERLFAGLIAKVSSDAAERPPAAEGVVRLVRSRPELQDSLLNWLRRVPVKSAGTWITNNWDQAFDELHRTNFGELVEQWGAQTENASLAKMAKLQKGSRSNLRKK